MKECPFCGCENEDSALTCRDCGISFEFYEKGQEIPQEEEKEKKKTPGEAAGGRKLGGLVAFVVLALLLSHMGADRVFADDLLVRIACLIPGLKALRRAVNVNCCAGREEQELNENIAFVLGIAAGILGLFLLLIPLHR